jgi:type IV fimbrial biogenesis protein FimT
MLVAHGNMMRERGFTLIEALVVLSIVAIVLAIGAPNLSFLIASMNARSASFDLIGDLALARSEAIKRNGVVTVQPLSGNNWALGWRVVAAATPTFPEMTIRQREALPTALSVASASNTLIFQPNGRIGADDTAKATWAITSSNATPRCVVITPTGAARSKVGAC